MEVNENIILSLKDHLTTRLTAMGYTNVYDISDMRNVPSGTLSLPTDKRYIFLTSTFQKPTVTTLPFIVLEANFDRETWQLGDDGDFRQIEVFVHVFGRSQSERNQLASYLQGANGIGRSIPYNNYTSGSGIAQAYPIQRTSGLRVDSAPPITNGQITEQSLANWNIVSFEAMTIL